MTNNARIGGIFSIVAGAFGVFYLIAAVIFIILMAMGYSWEYYGSYDYYPVYGSGVFFAIIIVWMMILTLLGVLAVVGGIFSLRRKVWGLALAGSIAGTLVFLPCGVIAIIFTAMAKPEFETRLPPSPQV